jgi:hypothetical protein
MKVASSTIFLLLISHLLSAQLMLSGKIQDTETNEPIPFAHIYSIEAGTTSNNEGEFTLKVSSLPIVLNVSHISYESKKFQLNELSEGGLNITLNLKATQLGDVFITPYNVIELVDNAVNKGLNDLSQKIDAEIFYRQITTMDEEPTEMIEAFYDGITSAAGLENIELKNGRFAKNKSNDEITYPSFVNFYYLSTIPVIQQEINDFIFPINNNYDRYYHYKLTKLLISKEDSFEIAVVNYTPKETSLIAMEGELYIDVKTHQIMKLTGTISDNMGIQFEKSNISIEIENAIFHIDITFDRFQYDVPVLSTINTNIDFDMIENGSKKDIFVTSTLFAYDHDIKNRNRSTERIGKDGDILKEISKTKYRKRFWKDNPIIKRTLEEQNIIKSFEELDLFKYQF